MAIKLFHFMHDESKAKWEFYLIEELETCYEATWKVTCKCGKVVYRKRAYMKPSNTLLELLNLCYKDSSIKRYIDNGTYHTFFGHTKESALIEAKQYKGDNYHI